PTACPPIWLAEKHPEILPVHKDGRTVGFGARQHRSYFSDQYVKYSLRIVDLMAQRYGSHPNVVAWQLDNEFGGETKYDYGACAKQAFHAYLAEKYGTIEALNDSWGTAFWSQHYHSFGQIPLPGPVSSDVMMWHHPSLELEFARFSSDGMVQFARMQARALRPYIGGRPITTNAFMFSWGDNVNWAEMFAELDVAGIDIYSSKPYEIAFYCDASRGVLAKPFWIMEFGASSPELEAKLSLVQGRGC
ncbi:beta-galactosidase, partial [Paenibacillus sepulcri]|nr:beta-galactosidase [Paenibacillus sepulcri]